MKKLHTEYYKYIAYCKLFFVKGTFPQTQYCIDEKLIHVLGVLGMFVFNI